MFFFAHEWWKYGIILRRRWRRSAFAWAAYRMPWIQTFPGQPGVAAKETPKMEGSMGKRLGNHLGMQVLMAEMLFQSTSINYNWYLVYDNKTITYFTKIPTGRTWSILEHVCIRFHSFPFPTEGLLWRPFYHFQRTAAIRRFLGKTITISRIFKFILGVVSYNLMSK